MSPTPIAMRPLRNIVRMSNLVRCLVEDFVLKGKIVNTLSTGNRKSILTEARMNGSVFVRMILKTVTPQAQHSEVPRAARIPSFGYSFLLNSFSARPATSQIPETTATVPSKIGAVIDSPKKMMLIRATKIEYE